VSKPRQTAPNPHKLQCHWWKGGKATTTHLVIVSKDGKSTKRQNRQNSRDNEQEAETFLEALKGVGQVAVSAPIDQRYEHPQHQARLVQGKTADGLAERTPSCDPCSGCKFTWCLHNVTPVRPASLDLYPHKMVYQISMIWDKTKHVLTAGPGNGSCR